MADDIHAKNQTGKKLTREKLYHVMRYYYVVDPDSTWDEACGLYGITKRGFWNRKQKKDDDYMDALSEVLQELEQELIPAAGRELLKAISGGDKRIAETVYKQWKGAKIELGVTGEIGVSHSVAIPVFGSGDVLGIDAEKNNKLKEEEEEIKEIEDEDE